MTMSLWDKAGRWVVLVALMVLLVSINLGIRAKEHTLAQGRRMVLQLAPADPRSLMQGDYMRLRFALATELNQVLKGEAERPLTRTAVVAPDARGVARLVRLDDGTALAANEARLLFRVREGAVRIVTDAWFFQEGQATLYAAARYSELRTTDTGEALLVDLLDENLQPIRAASKGVHNPT